MLTTLLLALVSSLTPAPALALQPAAATTPAAQTATAPSAAPAPKTLDWTIDGTKREAIIYFPATATTSPTPVVFAFHGHGGNARQAARSFEYQKHWPEAISVYMQGLPTPGALTDPEGKRNGWQKTVGDQNDRDLKFFDAVLATLRKDYKIDDARIYSTGHSNGGGFTYLLWSQRGDTFAAIAPSSAGPGGIREALALKPKPCMHIAGEKDPLVKFVNQQRTMDRVKKVNGCSEEPKQWGGSANAKEYPSKSGTPFISIIHSGGHEFHTAALPLIVKFFKENARQAAPAKQESHTPRDVWQVAPGVELPGGASVFLILIEKPYDRPDSIRTSGIRSIVWNDGTIVRTATDRSVVRGRLAAADARSFFEFVRAQPLWKTETIGGIGAGEGSQQLFLQDASRGIERTVPGHVFDAPSESRSPASKSAHEIVDAVDRAVILDSQPLIGFDTLYPKVSEHIRGR